jgi:hypothetical protein
MDRVVKFLCLTGASLGGFRGDIQKFGGFNSEISHIFGYTEIH